MVDRKKIIKWLETCIKGCDDSCPYKRECESKGGFIAPMADALALLKAQEPRVMTLDEVLDLKYDDVVYLEDFPTESIFSAIVIEVVPKLPDIDIGVVQFRFAFTWNGINNADLSYYGKTWRCWTSRPDEKRRAETPWE